ncbi:hypothetical protein AYO47_00545 [Planctomyces sp. SCGC AG-212-M04]|nr:hypothetical protein AYO47_00545 [Planctomyces sp. SCGC AG-212-M04]
MNWPLIAAQYALGLIAPRDLPHLADKLLQSSDDPQSVVDLAVLPPEDTVQIQRTFQCVLEDLNLEYPTENAALILVATQFARKVVHGQLPVYVGARQIADLWLYRTSADVPEVRHFYGLVHAYDESDPKEPEYLDRMLEECRRLAEADEGG